MSNNSASASVLVATSTAQAASTATKGPSATKTQRSIPLSVSDASSGERMYVLENEAYHSGAAMAAGRGASGRSHGGGRAGRRTGHGDKGGRDGALPDMTASLADFNVIGKFDVEEKKARIDDSEWVVVQTE